MACKNLFLMCGVPGSGKTTYIKNFIEKAEVPCIHVSRDAIRFSLLEDGEDYFSRETEVFDIFCDTINKALEEEGDMNIFVDATHLTEKSRNNTMDRLHLNGANLYAICMNVPLATCLKQNDYREGRAFVPHSVIRRMYTQYTLPTEEEKYKYTVLMVKDALNPGEE